MPPIFAEIKMKILWTPQTAKGFSSPLRGTPPYITNIIANKLQKEYSHTPFSLCNSKIFNYRYICNYFHREKKHYTIDLTKIVDSKLYFDHNYSSNPVVLKDIHIYMYLFCGRPCRRPVDGADVNFL